MSDGVAYQRMLQRRWGRWVTLPGRQGECPVWRTPASAPSFCAIVVTASALSMGLIVGRVHAVVKPEPGGAGHPLTAHGGAWNDA
jgi:hypothetical protein